MKNKIISFFIVLCLVANVFATDLKDMITDYRSSSGTWESPSTGTKYHYGGSYEFTFNGSNKFQPLITYETPSFKVGCNGVSLKGGFVGLLGLNEIKDQIKDAGASLAWGAMIALQYAVPALFDVFNKIRSWAATIQRMLQNACNIGTMLATSTISGNKAMQTVNNAINDNPISDTLQSGMTGLDGVFKEIDKFTNCSNLSTAPGPNGEISPAAKCMEKLGSTKPNPPKNSTNITAARFINTNIPIPDKSENKLFIDKLSNLLDNGKIDSTTVATGTDLAEFKNLIKITRVFFGDLAVDIDSYKSNVLAGTEAFEGKKGYEKGSYKISTKLIKDSLKKTASGDMKEQTPQKFKKIPAVISSAENAANALIYGIKKQTNTSNCGDGYCYIDDNTVYYYDFAESDDRHVGSGIVSDTTTSTKESLKLTWSGAYNESLKSIRTLVRKKTNIEPTYKTIYDDLKSTTIESNSFSTTIPLVVPNATRYVEIITKIEKVSNKETYLSAYLKNILAEQNSIQIARSLLNMLKGKISDLSQISGKVGDVLAFENDLLERKKAIEIEIDKIIDKSKDSKDLNEIFLSIEQELQNKKVRNF
ncbi:F-type type IV conjugative transfer system protein TraH (plasmid) [Malaciobacter mytili LMG 24559]|nr:conjugal transfer protein TraH [Malaciobacter mytili]AXH16400.1 F-type type IV conjugative transfer system protein TraH [Malaciobacter mytili LMG 24559]